MKALLVASLAAVICAPLAAAGPDAAPWHQSTPPRAPDYTDGANKHSLYIPGKDGTKLAIDYYLPNGMAPGARLPTILQQTRYFRSVVLTAEGMKSCRSVPEDFGYFTSRGYAVVIVDVRGTGASYGTRATELSEAEIADSAAVADWIVAQPWSSGRIGTTGISYVGATAELALLTRHPAFKAVVPLYPSHDSFADLYFPGGMRNHLHGEAWGKVTAEMDKAAPGELKTYPEVIGPCPVDGDEDGKLLAAARAEHQGNSNRSEELRRVRFRDEVRMPGGVWPGAHLQRERLDAANVPMLVIAGWHDSAFGDGAINRFLSSRSKQQWLVLAPTSHGGDNFYGPGTQTTTPSSFDVKAEMLRFFDGYLALPAKAAQSAPHLRWFVSGANVWREANRWPQPAAMQRLCLAAGKRLDARCSEPRGVIEIAPSDVQSTINGRWHTSMGKPVVYPDRASRDAALPTFQTPPLERDLEIFGSAMLSIPFRTTGRDADIVAYLEEVEPSGQAFYVTEGLLRASHAKPGKLPYESLGAQRTDLRKDEQAVQNRDLDLLVRLFPVAHRFKAGSRVRLVIAGSDVAVFDSATQHGDKWTLRTGKSHGANLTLPVFN